MNDANLTDLGFELHRGNVALWLGPDWSLPTHSNESVIARFPWTAVWTEATDGRLSSVLIAEWARADNKRLKQRFGREVPDRLEASLGSYYSFDEFCPIFYLNGKNDSYQAMPPREQRRARDEKVDELRRLNGGLLLVSGFDNVSVLADTLIDEFMSASDRLRIVVFGVAADATKTIAARVGAARASLLNRVTCDAASLFSILDRVTALHAETPPPEPSIKVGPYHLPLAPLLSAKLDPPLDQYFEIVGSDAILPPQDGEDRGKLREELVRGRGAEWRAFAHNLQWRRNRSRVDEVVNHFHSMGQQGGSHVACINVIGERGSGLTTCLREIAFRTAQMGSPTLVNRAETQEIDYDSLRVFLERIDEEVAKRGGNKTARPVPTIIFDSVDSAEDAISNLRHLPKRLAGDGRNALIVRGISVRSGHVVDESFKNELTVSSGRGKVEEVWLGSTLKAALQPEERRDLCNWASSGWQTISSHGLESIISEWGSDWTGDANDCPPLLICLYFILRGNVSASTELGRHLFQRIRPFLEGSPNGSKGDAEESMGRPLSSDQLAAACEMLQRKFNRSIANNSDVNELQVQPSREKYLDVLAVLSALGSLRVGISRTAMSQLCGIDTDSVNRIFVDLEMCDLLTTSSPDPQNYNSPAAYYRFPETVGLRHPAYGRLIFEWARSAEAKQLLNWLVASAWFRKLLELIDERGLGPYPIWLLKPLLSALVPTSTQVQFVEDVSSRFLRIQRLKGSAYHKWMFGFAPYQGEQCEVVYEVIEAVPEELVRQRSAILHTRGITRYKSCRPAIPIQVCRRRYEDAWNDFDLALTRAEAETSGENPANIITSKGLSCMFRSNMERDRTDGDHAVAEETDRRALECFREALERRRDNPYASYGLAEFLICSCERIAKEYSDIKIPISVAKQYVEGLSEACEQLQIEPSEAYRADWEELWRRAGQLLSSAAAKERIQQLKSEGEEIGYALDALRLLGGRIPIEPTSDEGEVEELELAQQVLDDALKNADTRSSLADLLRYAVFSAHSDRLREPDHRRRFDLISRLKDTPHLRNPVWLFDYGMLALQVRKIEEGLAAFSDLRKAGRFFEVPLERQVFLTKPENADEREVGVIRVVRIDPDGKGWAKLDTPPGFKDSIPFSQAEFSQQTSRIQPGRTLSCYIRIRPSGPFAAPIDRR